MIEQQTITTTEALAEHLKTSREPVNVSEELRNEWMLRNIQVKRDSGHRIRLKWDDLGGGIWRVKR